MIVLDKNELTFEAASIDAALADRTVHFAQQWLPQILAPKPLIVLKRLLATDYCRLSAEQRKTVTRVVSRLTPDHLAAEFTRQLSGNVKVHKARVSIDFHRTLRLPDDGQVYLLPSGFGRFPLRPVDLCSKHLPASCIERGGLLMPMYQAEALWLGFNNRYPWAFKVGAGPINALNGHP
jgi:hypothetical protein